MSADDDDAPVVGSREKEPEYSRFTQQELPACRPLLTPKKVIAMFLTIGVVFIPIGAACLAASRSVVEVSARYDDDAGCMAGANNVERKVNLLETKGAGTTCTVTLTAPADMKAPVYFYYKLTNFYQNHRRYVKSRADAQLRGDEGPLTDDVMADCEPQLYTDPDSSQGLIKPCGLMAWSFFNDTYAMKLGGEAAVLNEKGIAWKSDRLDKFSDKEAINFQVDPDKRGGAVLEGPMNDNEHFIVWMRTAALPTFRKLWGIYEGETIAKGTEITVDIANRYNTYAFDGSKTIILSTTSWMGGKNDFMGIAYLAIGCLCLVAGIVCSLIHLKKPRVLGDTTLLTWNK